MIQNGKDFPLSMSTGNLPNMSDALTSWFQAMQFVTLVHTVVDFQEVSIPTTIDFMGVMQPFSMEQLAMKPSGERSWKWHTLHAQVGLVLATDDVVNYLDAQYRVKARGDYTKYGYVEYQLIEDFTGSGP